MRTNNSGKAVTYQVNSSLAYQIRLKKIGKLKLEASLSKAEVLFEKVSALSHLQRRTLNFLLQLAVWCKSLYMSQSWLAKKLGCCRQAINDALQLLKDLDLIYSKSRRYHYGWRTNVYGIKGAFYDPSSAHLLYTILSTLRQFRNRATQLSNELYINQYQKQTEQPVATKTAEVLPQQTKTDVMSWSLDDILGLRRQSEPKPEVRTHQNPVFRRPGFKRVGDI